MTQQFRLVELVQKHLGTKLRGADLLILSHLLLMEKTSCTRFIGRLSYPICVGLYIYIFQYVECRLIQDVLKW